jgi:hypothetical protein
MKYALITLSTLLCISLVGLGINCYRFNTEYSKTKDINNKIDNINKGINEMDKYLEENKDTYDEFLKNNKTKIEVYEKWLRYQKEVTESL